ncbi:hypothetical protein HGRIS_004439 [Hohenbuehelia grisea]|uniref:Uncharacterized protein n=1 Tax=Hohenbuehelia grisea TaxID=104357 RepID=A0ABR3JC06_9AGAR
MRGADAHEYLKDSPNIVSCHFTLATTPPCATPSNGPLTLPRLQRLRLSVKNVYRTHLLQFLTTPALEYLAISCLFPNVFFSLAGMLGRSSCHLQHLQISDLVNLDVDGIHLILAATPDLRMLTLTGASKAIDQLLSIVADSTVLPRLRHIQIVYPASECVEASFEDAHANQIAELLRSRSNHHTPALDFTISINSLDTTLLPEELRHFVKIQTLPLS